MNVFSLAVRNLLRNRRRSLTTLVAVALGTAAILLFGGYRAAINYAMQTVYVRSGGHLQIQHRDFFLFGSGNPTGYAIEHYQAIIDAIRKDPTLREMVLVVTPTLQLGGIAGNYAAGVSRTVVGLGLVASDHVAMRKWDPYDVGFAAPELELDGAASNAAVIGIGLARVLQLCAPLGIEDCPKPARHGDEPSGNGVALPDDVAALAAAAGPAPKEEPRNIELLSGNARGTPNVATLRIVAAEQQGFKELDEIYMLLHLTQAQRLVYGSSAPKVTAILVQLRDTARTAEVHEHIETRLAEWSAGQPLVVRDFGELNPFYVQSVQLFDTIFGFMFLLIGGIVMFTVSNTMNASVVERTIEVGTLRAIGLRQLGIRRMFIAEGSVIGAAGALLGVACALAGSAIVNRMELTWTPPGAAGPVPLNLVVWGETLMIIGTALCLVAVTIASAWWPAYRAARLNVVEALRHV
ncbi:MAG TPA: FtsX-like permease family protein [Rubrivivax sp.]|nr:FtsX-like permease family protein [Burkholderiales bacterium]HNU10169.1 FtsX-like permease family protein [Rubrivivax sp.]